MITTLIFIAVIAVLIVGHELGHFLFAKLFRLRVEEFAFGFPPKLFSFKKGETKYSINLIPLGGFVKIYGESDTGEIDEPNRSFYHQPAWKRSLVLVAGVLMNFIIGWFAFSAIFMTGVPHKVYISYVAPESPAAEAGLVAGEEVQGFNSTDEFLTYIDENAGKEITINDKTLVPRVNPPEDEGRIGVGISDAYIEPRGFFKSIVDGFTRAVNTLGGILAGLWYILTQLFTGGEVGEAVSGPVGIFKIVGDASTLGFIYLLNLLGILSLNLAIFNLLPVPALDGGRLFFVGIEKVIGRRLSPTHENVVNLIGFALLMLLAVVVTVNDVVKLF